jgi:hypothetical protein
MRYFVILLKSALTQVCIVCAEVWVACGDRRVIW